MESVDRLSSLSDLVLHHVLSFLTIQDVAKLSFASKKYLNVCLSVPSLSIDSYHDISSDEGSHVQRNQFMDFIVNFIKRRRGTQMTKLSITWHSPKLTWNQAFRVFSWLNHAMACHLNEIDLTLDLQSGTFLLPLEVFWCESLRSLTINLYQCKLELPSPHAFSHLKYLHLLYVQVVDESLGEWISSTCKFLEILKLHIVSGVQIFRISSASLLEISVSGCSFDYLDISAQLLHTISLYLSVTALLVNVYAPNLFGVCYSGVFPKLSSVEMKKTELKYFVSLDLRSWTNGLQSFLPYIVPVTDLVIDCNSIQVLYENKCLPSAFSNLQSLVLNYDLLTKTTYPATVLFLQGLPHNLNKLHMECRCYVNYRPEQDFVFWESKNLSFLDELEEVKIDIFGGKKEPKLVRCLLEKAKRLKKMRISTGYRSIPTELKRIIVEAASIKGADLRSQGNTMILELKPQI